MIRRTTILKFWVKKIKKSLKYWKGRKKSKQRRILKRMQNRRRRRKSKWSKQ